jgi:F-type H+-transporting ATPase subunit gamma
MPNLKEVRNRIQSVKSTQQITKAMKMVSAAKLRRAQDAITQMRPYAERLQAIIQNISANMEGELSSVFTQDRVPEKVMIVVITSDRGLCGAFNANVAKAAMALAQEKYANQLNTGNVRFLHIGNKGYDTLRRRGYQVQKDFVGLFQNLSFEKVKEAGEYILGAFASGEIDRVEIVYNEFKNVITQVLRQQQFLPIAAQPQDFAKSGKALTTEYIFEPSKEEIIQELIPKNLKIQLYKAVLDSNAAEQGARMSAMDKATENAGELIKELQLTYNRARQAAITKEILEIVGGAEALKG